MINQTQTASGIKIGARLAVELLRCSVKQPESACFTLTHGRSRHGFALLLDKLSLIQEECQSTSMDRTVIALLEATCQEHCIAVPLAEPDWGGIQLIDVVFDDALASNDLDRETQQWFSMLRVPVARYALQEYGFFYSQQNLLRRFLDQFYFYTLSSAEKSRNAQRTHLSQFVQRICEDNKASPEWVNSICIEAQAWFAGHDEKVQRIQSQLRKMESVKHKEQVAEPRVVDHLNQVMCNQLLPEQAIEFLHGEWRQSLLLISMQEGEEGKTWKRQVRTTESIVEFLLGCRDSGSIKKYQSFYPILLKNIKSLLVSVNDDPERFEAVMDPLELVLSALINGADLPVVNVKLLECAQRKVESIQLKQVGTQAWQRISALNEGDLVRLKTASGDFEVCSLTLKNEGDAPWVFLGQSGKTIAKKTAFQLAQAYESGVISIVEQTRWWNHWLEVKMLELHRLWQQAAKQAAATKKAPDHEYTNDVNKNENNHDIAFEVIELDSVEVEPKETQNTAPPATEDINADALPAKEALSAKTVSDEVDGSDTESKSRAKPNKQNADIDNIPESSTTISETKTTSEPKQIKKLDTTTDEPVYLDTGMDFVEPRPVSEAELSAALQVIEQLQVGGWIVQETSEGEKRCKLAVKIRGHAKLVFVDRLGMKTLEIEREPLAQLLVRGAVSIVDMGAQFDNTLEKIVRNIQQEKH